MSKDAPTAPEDISKVLTSILKQLAALPKDKQVRVIETLNVFYGIGKEQ